MPHVASIPDRRDRANRDTDSTSAFAPPVRLMMPTIPPRARVKMRILMFSVTAATRCASNVRRIAVKGFPTTIQTPTQMPARSARSTCRNATASAIARSGGTMLSQPGMMRGVQVDSTEPARTVTVAPERETPSSFTSPRVKGPVDASGAPPRTSPVTSAGPVNDSTTFPEASTARTVTAASMPPMR